MTQLRPYQEEGVNAAWAKISISDNALVVMSTGLGKTELVFGIMHRAVTVKPDIRIVFCVNRIDLLKQTFRRLASHFPLHWLGVYSGGTGNYERSKAITVGTIQSLEKADLSHVSLIIFDEAHRVSTDEDSQYAKFIAQQRSRNPKLKIVGLTATPFRATGYIYGKGELFDKIAYDKGLKWAIENNFLVKPRMKRVQEQFDTRGLNIVAGDFDQGQLANLATEDKLKAQVKDALPRLEDRAKIVWACTCIEHSENLARFLREAGEDAVAYHSKTPDRDSVMNKWKSSGRHMTFVTIISEGFDHPPIDAVCLCRPTRSPVLYIQTVGRGLRPSPGKDDCLVLDFGRVVENCGPLDSPRVPKKGEKNKPLDAMKFCPECLEYLPKEEMVCPCCGYTFPAVKVEVDRYKSLEVRHKAADILSRSEPKPPVWINIQNVTIGQHKSKNGRNCVKVTYWPQEVHKPPVIDYAVFGDAWLNERAAKKLERVGISVRSFEEAKLITEIRTKVIAIKVDFKDFPEICEWKYEER